MGVAYSAGFRGDKIMYLWFIHERSFCRKKNTRGISWNHGFVLLRHKFLYNWEHWNDVRCCCWNAGLVSCFDRLCCVPQALLGQLIFGDSLVALWWVGVSLTFSGLLVLQRSSSTNTHSGNLKKDEWDDVTWGETHCCSSWRSFRTSETKSNHMSVKKQQHFSQKYSCVLQNNPWRWQKHKNWEQ